MAMDDSARTSHDFSLQPRAVTRLALILLFVASSAWAQPADTFQPPYQTYIAPADPTTGRLIAKGEVAETDVRVICAGKGIFRNVAHAGGTYSQNHRLSQNEQTKRAVMEQSGIPWEDRIHYEDDHMTPLCAGGSDSIRNRWAQPRFGVWNSARKDELEAAACQMICSGEVDLPTAQGWFNTTITPDWRAPYCATFEDADCAELGR